MAAFTLGGILGVIVGAGGLAAVLLFMNRTERRG
jgi:hypothetical protein